MHTTKEKVAVWLTNGIPVRLVWEGRRHRVNDTPTRLGDPSVDWWLPVITHPPAEWIGWRFQAVDEDGRAFMFEVQYIESREEWELLRVYE